MNDFIAVAVTLVGTGAGYYMGFRNGVTEGEAEASSILHKFWAETMKEYIKVKFVDKEGNEITKEEDDE